MKMNGDLKIPGVCVIEPKIWGDTRGFFFEAYKKSWFESQGVAVDFVQDNVSRSGANILRGLHHQREHTQGKLVQVLCGKVLDVIVDIRLGSPTFGQWMAEELDDQAHKLLYIPPGCAHGFCVLSDYVDFYYKCTDYYHPASELTIRWDDPDIGIDWPIQNPILSKKDQHGVSLKDIPEAELPRYGLVS